MDLPEYLTSLSKECPDDDYQKLLDTIMRAETRGGARVGAGRPRLTGTKPQMKSVKLSLEHWERAKTIGGGSMAEGLRRALEAYGK